LAFENVHVVGLITKKLLWLIWTSRAPN